MISWPWLIVASLFALAGGTVLGWYVALRCVRSILSDHLTRAELADLRAKLKVDLSR